MEPKSLNFFPTFSTSWNEAKIHSTFFSTFFQLPEMDPKFPQLFFNFFQLPKIKPTFFQLFLQLFLRKKSWKQVDFWNFPGSKEEKWSKFGKFNFYLEKVEKKLFFGIFQDPKRKNDQNLENSTFTWKKLKKSWFLEFSRIQRGKMIKIWKIQLLPGKNWKKVEKKLIFGIFQDPKRKNDQNLENSTFTWKKLKKSWKKSWFLEFSRIQRGKMIKIWKIQLLPGKSWKKVEKSWKKVDFWNFPGSKEEKWSKFGKFNFYLEKVEKKLKKSWFLEFSRIQRGKMIKIWKIQLLPGKNWKKVEKKLIFGIFQDPKRKNDQNLENSTFTWKKLKKSWFLEFSRIQRGKMIKIWKIQLLPGNSWKKLKKSWKKVDFWNFPGSKEEKWSKFGKFNFYLEKVEKSWKKVDFWNFPGSKEEKWSKFGNFNFYLEKVEKEFDFWNFPGSRGKPPFPPSSFLHLQNSLPGPDPTPIWTTTPLPIPHPHCCRSCMILAGNSSGRHSRQRGGAFWMFPVNLLLGLVTVASRGVGCHATRECLICWTVPGCNPANVSVCHWKETWLMKDLLLESKQVFLLISVRII